MFNRIKKTILFQAWASALLCLLSHNCFAVSPPSSSANAWFTGPLLTPSGKVVPKGHFNLEPYLFCSISKGRYGPAWKSISHPKFSQITPQLQIKVGLTERLDTSICLQSVYSKTRGISSSSFGDLPISFDYQIIPPSDGNAVLKFTLQEIFPTGKFKGLNPALFNTDVGGLGSFVTIFGITGAKLFHLPQKRYLSTRANISLALPAPAHIRGYNVYGGDFSTRGKAYPGIALSIFIGSEYTLTENWVLALDILSEFSAKSRFRGYSETPVCLPSSSQFSLAPAIEYNWSQSIGVIAGPWFTVAGRNCPSFISFVGAINMYF